jgi:hypothetical protein
MKKWIGVVGAMPALALPSISVEVPASAAPSTRGTQAVPDDVAAQAVSYARYVEAQLLPTAQRLAVRAPSGLTSRASSALSAEAQAKVAERVAMAERGTSVIAVSVEGAATGPPLRHPDGVSTLAVQVRTSRTLNDGVVWDSRSTSFVDYDPSGVIVSMVTPADAELTAGEDLIEDPTATANGTPSATTFGASPAPTAESAQRSSGFISMLVERDDAVRYALHWAFDRNDDFVSYHNDCTNFISQTMLAGMWWMRDGGGVTAKRSTSNWFHHSKSNVSWSWGGAENFYQYGRKKSGWLTTPPGNNVWNLVLGDLLQVDWDKNGNIQHSMIVTKKNTTTGERYLTYHSTDQRNKPLSAVLASDRDAWWYGHRT